MDHFGDPLTAQEEQMPRVPPPENKERKKRYVCSLPTSTFQVWSDYALMLEEIALANGNEPARRRRQNDSGPAHSTMDHVLYNYITKILATDPAFIKWLRAKHTDGSAPAELTASTRRPS
jgi:hypothetical protein